MKRVPDRCLSYMKETVGELASHFKNGEVYTKMMDNIHDLNTMIAYLSQFLAAVGTGAL